MLFLGIILIIAGVASAIYGNSLNNDLGSQLESLFSSASTNPGDIWLYAGIAAAVIGLILAIAGIVKKK